MVQFSKNKHISLPVALKAIKRLEIEKITFKEWCFLRDGGCEYQSFNYSENSPVKKQNRSFAFYNSVILPVLR